MEEKVILNPGEEKENFPEHYGRESYRESRGRERKTFQNTMEEKVGKKAGYMAIMDLACGNFLILSPCERGEGR